MTFYIKKSNHIQVFCSCQCLLVLACFFLFEISRVKRKLKRMLPCDSLGTKFGMKWKVYSMIYRYICLNLLGYHCMSRLIINSLSFDFH